MLFYLQQGILNVILRQYMLSKMVGVKSLSTCTFSIQILSTLLRICTIWFKQKNQKFISLYLRRIDNFVISITHYFTIEWVVYNLSLEWFWKLKQDNKKLKMWKEQHKKPVPIFKDQIRAFHRGQSTSRYARNFIIP